MSGAIDDKRNGLAFLAARGWMEAGGRADPASAFLVLTDAAARRTAIEARSEAAAGGDVETAAASLAAEIVEVALSADAALFHPHYWFSATARLLVQRRQEASSGPPASVWRRVRRDLQDMIAMAINLRGHGDEAFLAAYDAECAAPSRDRSQSPAAALNLLALTLTFCGPDWRSVFALIARTDASERASAGFLGGAVIGAYVGLGAARTAFPS